MKFSWVAGVLLILVGTGPLSAQQPSAPTAGLEIDLPEVVAQVKAAHAAYNQALNSGNIAVQNGTFRNDERTIRYGGAENLYGYKAIESFSTTARPIDPPLGAGAAAAASGYAHPAQVTSDTFRV